MCVDTSKYMRCHADGVRQHKLMMSHLVDAKYWKKFKVTHPTFALDPQNVRLGLLHIWL